MRRRTDAIRTDRHCRIVQKDSESYDDGDAQHDATEQRLVRPALSGMNHIGTVCGGSHSLVFVCGGCVLR